MAAELTLYLSGGAANADPALSLGGAKSSVALPNDNTLWDKVLAAEALAGDVEYRCVYLQNTGDQTLDLATLYFSDQPTQGVLALAVAAAAKNTAAETLADESTAPTGGETFASPSTPETGPSVDILTPGDYRGVYLRRTMSASTPGVSLGANTAAVNRYLLHTPV